MLLRLLLLSALLLPAEILASPPEAAKPRAGDSTPAPADLTSVLNAAFGSVADKVKVVVETRPDRFSEISAQEIETARGKLVLDWRATEHLDLECPDERKEHTAARRPFCLKSDGTTVLSATYFSSTASNPRERIAIVSGVLLRVAGIQGSANRALALRIADLALENGYSPDAVPTPKAPPSDDPVHGMGRIAIGAGGGVASEKGAGTNGQFGAALDLAGAMRGRFGGVGDGHMTNAYGTVHGRLADQNGVAVYNLDAHAEIALYPVLVGVWLAVKCNQFQTFREGFFALGLPILSIPIQLGGDDYLMIKVNAGEVPLYAPDSGSGAHQPAGSDSLQFSGVTFNAELILKTGAFFLNLQGEGSSLKDSNGYGEFKDAHYRALEFTANAGAKLNLLFPNSEITLEARHNSLVPNDKGLPGIDYKANVLGVRYGFSW